MINGYSIGDFSRNVAYEAQRNLVSIVSNAYDNVSLSRFAYTNDAAGRRTNREDSGSAFASTQANSFGYNAKSEVTSANMRNGTSSYNFDQIGNRIQVSVPDEPNPLDYTTNALNQYVETGAPTLLSAYDLDGNLVNDGKGTIFEWNAENRMVRVTTPTKVIENTFDAQGRRVRKKVFTSDFSTLTSDIRYFYDGWNVIYEDDVFSSADTKYYVWGLDLSQSIQGAGGVGGLLLVKQGTTTWAPTYDANGNISEYINLADGAVTAHQEYDAFGRKIVATGTAPSTFGFSTKYEDVETGYLYYGFRFYDPQTGRWPNRDPIEEEGGGNLYGFVKPINGFDVLGLIFMIVIPEVRFVEEYNALYHETYIQHSQRTATAQYVSIANRGAFSSNTRSALNYNTGKIRFRNKYHDLVEYVETVNYHCFCDDDGKLNLVEASYDTLQWHHGNLAKTLSEKGSTLLEKHILNLIGLGVVESGYNFFTSTTNEHFYVKKGPLSTRKVIHDNNSIIYEHDFSYEYVERIPGKWLWSGHDDVLRAKIKPSSIRVRCGMKNGGIDLQVEGLEKKNHHVIDEFDVIAGKEPLLG